MSIKDAALELEELIKQRHRNIYEDLSEVTQQVYDVVEVEWLQELIRKWRE